MPANTPLANLPYPLLADAPADIEAAVKPLALALDPLQNTLAQRAAQQGFGATAPSDANRFATEADIGAPVPIGAIVPYAGSALPAGGQWDWADGGLVSASAYPAFAAAVGHAYNGGLDPGGGTVRKPDKRGRVPVGADNFGQGAANRIPNSNRARGQGGGSEQHVLTTAQLPSHQHADGTLAANSHVHSLAGSFLNVPAGHLMSGRYNTYASQANYYAHDTIGLNSAASLGYNIGGSGAVAVSGSTDVTGSGTAHPNLQPYEVDTYIVRIA